MDGEGNAPDDLDRRQGQPRLAFGACRGLGGGLYLVSLYAGSPGGAAAGWLIVAAKSALHCVHLGKPGRFWRLLVQPGRSWLARGFIFVSLFLAAGLAQIACSYLSPGAFIYPLKALSGLAAVLVITYIGFMMNRLRGIPLWKSALLPALFFLTGILGGLGVLLVFTGEAAEWSVPAARIVLIIHLILLAAYIVQVAYGRGPSGKESVRALLLGPPSAVLWLGLVVCGLAVPLVILSVAPPGAVAAMAGAGAAILVGVFSLHYCLLKGARYYPLIPGE